jgi:hypothetical protein
MTTHGRPTDHANLDLAELNRRVVRGEAGGMIIWQPRMLAWFTERNFRNLPYPERYQGMTPAQVYRDLAVSDRLYQFNGCLVREEDPRVRHFTRQLNDSDLELVWETPVGTQNEIRHSVRESWYHHTPKREITTEDDMRVALWRNEHTTYRWDQAHFDEMMAHFGDLGAPTVFIPRVTVQDLYINTMGVEAGIMALYEWPDLVEDYFRSLDDLHDRCIDVVNASPIEIVNFGDNVHAQTLSPDLFLQYVLPSYQRRTERLHKAGKFVHAHFDGDTKPLLPFLKETGLDGIEAITPVPQGDVTLEEAKGGLGDDLFLLDGIPAVIFDEHWPAEMVEEYARKCIELFAPKLVLGISDEIAYTGDFERVRRVREIVDDYNASAAAKSGADWFLHHQKHTGPQPTKGI